MKTSKIISVSSATFNSRKLFNIKLYQFCDFDLPRKVGGYISELEPSDIRKPELAIDEISDFDYCEKIISSFKKRLKKIKKHPNYRENEKYLAVESLNPDNSSRIITLGKLHLGTNNVLIQLLQSMHGKDIITNLRGGGSCLLYGAEKLAEKYGKKKINLYADSEAKGFYIRNGLIQHKDTSLFELPRENFAIFKQNLEKEFEITPYKK